MSKQIKFFLFPSICLAVLLLAACGGKFSSPESTTKGFLSALVKKDFESAFEHVHPGIQAEPGAKETLIGMMQARSKQDAVVDFEILGSEIDGDEASVRVSVELESGSSNR